MFWFKMSSAVYVVGCFPFSLNSCTLSSNSIISACYQNWWQESWSHTGLPLWGQTSKTHCKMGLHMAKQRQMYLLSKNTTVGLTSGHVSPKQRHRNSKCLFKPAMEFTTPYRSCQNHITSQFFSPPILTCSTSEAHQNLKSGIQKQPPPLLLEEPSLLLMAWWSPIYAFPSLHALCLLQRHWACIAFSLNSTWIKQATSGKCFHQNFKNSHFHVFKIIFMPLSHWWLRP